MLRLPGQLYHHSTRLVETNLLHVMVLSLLNTIQVYQKKIQVEKDIVDIVEQMNDTLSFVEEANMLKERVEKLTKPIQSALEKIKECSELIHTYMKAGTARK